MATLPIEDRERIRRGLESYWSSLRELTAVSSQAVQAAVDATDQWIEDNQVSFNNALPVEARTNLTQTQKTLLLCAVALARVSIAFLRRIFGEVG